MGKLTFDEIRKRGLLLFEYVRGSKLYHTDTPDSDEDRGGVFITPQDFDFGFEEEVADDKGDTKWWELGKFMRLAMTSNPAVIEAFFVPDELVIYEHPLFREIRNQRDKFVTKACFKPFGNYAVSQIQKAQGQNKKIHWDMEDMKRKTPLDFCFTYDGRQGSTNIQKWLDSNGLRQDCCGLVNLANMKDCYLMYYDFGQHFRLTGRTFDDERGDNSDFYSFMREHFDAEWREDNGTGGLDDYIERHTAEPLGDHCGIVNNDGTSNSVRLCSTKKFERPVCIMTYNSDGYGSHCRKHKEYEEWKAKRNKARYESNLKAEQSGDPDMKYDCKNMYHCFRMVAMCTEIAQGKGIILDRSGIDRDFLMDVRNRKFGYSELSAKLKEMTEEMQKACEESTIPESIDERFVKKLVSDTRRKFPKFNEEMKKVQRESVFNDSVIWKLIVLRLFLERTGIPVKDVMLTGSLALYKHRMLPEGHGVADIDIVVKGDSELDRDFVTLTKLNGGNEFWKLPETLFAGIRHKPFIFTWEGVKFNVWVQDPEIEFDSDITTSEGYRLATVKHILDAKKAYGRTKDMNDILQIGMEVIDGNRNSGY